MRGSVALLTLGAVAFGYTYSDNAPLIPLVSADFALDDLRAGLLSTALFLVYIATTLPFPVAWALVGALALVALGATVVMRGEEDLP